MTLTADESIGASSLLDICSQFVAVNGKKIFAKTEPIEDNAFIDIDDDDEDLDDEEELERRRADVATKLSNKDIVLPVPVSESVFNSFNRLATKLRFFRSEPRQRFEDKVLIDLFSEAQKTPLWNINLDGCKLSDSEFATFLAVHSRNLLSLSLAECEELTELINFEVRNINASKLHTLHLGSLVNLFGPWLTAANVADASTSTAQNTETSMSGSDNDGLEYSLMDAESTKTNISSATCSTKEEANLNGGALKPIFTRICPNLLNFTLHGDLLENVFDIEDIELKQRVFHQFFVYLFQYTRNLRRLDLSYWSGLGDLSFLSGFHLSCLILHEVPDLHRAVDCICELKTLQHLDVSQSNQETGVFPLPVTTLDRLVSNLTYLLSLDITSTNLASNPTKGDWPPLRSNGIESDIVGLAGLKRPLEFLGIFACDLVSHYHKIPSAKVAGDGSEEQILLAIEIYSRRPALLVAVLNEAYQIYRFGVSVQHRRALHLMLKAMNDHISSANIQIASSASVFYIIRNVQMNQLTKKKVIASLLNAMERHLQEQTLVRNCCLSLCQFEVPVDILHDYKRAVRLLLQVMRVFNDQMTQRIVIYLLNSLACHVDGAQKFAVGSLGAIDVVLEVIRRRAETGVCDEVMEVSWSFLWNITDETPLNCDKFLNGDGMKLFQKCNETFLDRTELLRNMMGLMGNIAEVKNLRSHLMEPQYVTVFCGLLKNVTDGIEISYNSAGVLAHMISDGDVAWTIDRPTRKDVSDCVVQAVQTWPLSAKRFINYRSFEPILRLLPLDDSYASQYWAVWALANLTTVDGPKYTTFVVEENGVPLLRSLLERPTTNSTIRDLTKKILQNVADHKGITV